MQGVYPIAEGQFSTFQIRGDRCELKIGPDVVTFDLETTGDRLVALLEAHLKDQNQLRLDWMEAESCR